MMKLIGKSTISLLLFSANALATEPNFLIENVELYQTQQNVLSVQNLSKEYVEITLFDSNFELPSSSGVQFECRGYELVELQIKHTDHDYIEVPCSSRIVIKESFINKYQ